jgi:uncharacterized DUF497 family protein
VYIQLSLRFEWDEAKRESNRSRHKLDLADAALLFDGRRVITVPSPRDGEARFVTVGPVGAKFYAAVWTMRSETIRLISFRRARDGEERAHRSCHGG